ncbi:MAG TPA: FdhF/YdeP family oxidoreductase [Polyangiaceae bacterium]
MSDHRVRPTNRLLKLVPFGLGSTKPHHFRDMLRVALENQDNLEYAWKVLSEGVCDGCALGVTGFRDWTIEGVHLCMTRLNLLRLNTMGAMDPAVLYDIDGLRARPNSELRTLGRLSCPLRRDRGERGFHRISWHEALEHIALRIRNSDPSRLAFYLTSRSITNEVYYTAQKVVRFLGTNNIDNAARLCHSPSTAAMKAAVGVSASTCSYKDWFDSNLLVFFGANPANDQPVTTKYIHAARQRGTRVALVNPYLEPGMQRYWVPSTASSALFGTDIADWWFPVATGGDIAFLYGVLRILIQEDWLDRDFIRGQTEGFEALSARASEQDWQVLESSSGLSLASMHQFAEMIRDARRAVLIWSMGITQHAFGGDAVQMILNLGLSQGYVGRLGCGLMPIRGHSGVQGGAEMGAYATAFPAGRKIEPESARALSELYGFEVPSKPGLSATEMVTAAERGELDLLYCVGGAFTRTLPRPERVQAALSNVPLRVYQDIIVSSDMLVDPKDTVILLPAKTRYEQDGGGTETTTERRILFSPELPRQVGEARAEWRIFLDLARAVDNQGAERLGCESGQAIREEIARVVPFYAGIQHLKRSGDAVQYGGPRLCENAQFSTPDGKAHFVPVELPPRERGDGEFVLSTRRGKQFNSMVYAETDPLTGAARDAIFMNNEDAAALGLARGDAVSLVSKAGRYSGRVFLAPIARSNVQVHFPEGNVLIDADRVDRLGGVPDYNTVVRIERGG